MNRHPAWIDAGWLVMTLALGSVYLIDGGMAGTLCGGAAGALLVSGNPGWKPMGRVGGAAVRWLPWVIGLVMMWTKAGLMGEGWSPSREQLVIGFNVFVASLVLIGGYRQISNAEGSAVLSAGEGKR